MIVLWKLTFAAVVCGFLVVGGLRSPARAGEDGVAAIYQARCGTCHDGLSQVQRQNIGRIRKSPEGWELALSRLSKGHGATILQGERRALVRHLAGVQGLAPTEAAAGRHALERRPGTTLSEAFSGRDDKAWEMWKGYVAPNLSGFWRVVRQLPDGRLTTGRVTIRRQEIDGYRVNYQLVDKKGAPWQGYGEAVLFTGFEWRSSLVHDDQRILEVGTLAADGNAFQGRWFRQNETGHGGFFRAVRIGTGISAVMAVSPSSLKPGEAAELNIYGTGLNGAVSFGSGVELLRTVIQNPVRIVVEVRVDSDAQPGSRTVVVGGNRAMDLFAVETEK